MNYKSFNLGDWIGHISGVIEDEGELDGNEMRDLVEFLSGLPRWIPVSERLPEEDGDYMLWGKVTEFDEEEYRFIGSYDSGCEKFGVWEMQYDSTTLGCLGSEFFEYNRVLAWQPLPEPYKAEGVRE